MKTVRYIYWQDEDMWLGHIEEFPDYMTQGESPEELQENLRDLYSDLSGSKIPGVRHACKFCDFEDKSFVPKDKLAVYF